MKILFLLLCFSINTFAQFELLDPIQRIVFECQMRGGCSMKRAESETEKDKYRREECTRQFVNIGKSFLDDTTKKQIRSVGYFRGEPFSRVEIENINPVRTNSIRIVRGSSRYSFETIGTNVPFPHSSSTCNEYFIEKNEVIEIGNRKCRKTIMTLPDDESRSYAQIYCEGSNRLFLTYMPQREILPEELQLDRDCPHCR